MKKFLLILTLLLAGFATWAQKPGSTPVKVSHEKQMLQGRKYYVHIVEKGQTVYSIAKAYKVQSYDAVTHVDIHSLHPGDTVWLPFRGQFSEEEEQMTSTPATVSAPVTVRVDTVHVPVYIHDTAYINVPYAVHDTTIVTNTVTLTEYVRVHDTTIVTDTVTLTKYVTVHDTTHINVPYAVHDTTIVRDTVTLTEYVKVHDTTHVNVPYTVRDTVIVTDTVTLTEYVKVHDTTHINVPYAIHDTTIVRDTVTLTEYVKVHDTTHINVPYAVRDTIIVTNTVTQTEYVPVHDTTYINVHDTTIVTNTVTQTEYVNVHDTIYINVHDTTHIETPYAVHDTIIVTDTVTLTEYVKVHDTTHINVPYAVRDTIIVIDTVTLTEYVKVHDTTHINVPYAVRDTIILTDTVTLTEYVKVHDTTHINVPYAVRDTIILTDTVTLIEYVKVHDTTHVNVPYAVHDTTIVTDTVTQTEYVNVHDTIYINVHDTTHIDAPYAVHDTTIVTNTVTQTEYVNVHDTIYINVHDTTHIETPYAVHDTTIVTDTVTLTEYVKVHDTTHINVPYAVRDTIILTDTVTLTEYVQVHDTTFINVHDTTFVIDTVDLALASASSSDLALASASAVALTGYVPASQQAMGLADPATAQSQEPAGKTLKVALMMPLHLNEIDEISTTKFDVEQRGKKSYRQFEFIEFYEGILLALEKLPSLGINTRVELNVVDVTENTAESVERAFHTHNVAQSDVVIALLFRDAFTKAAELSRLAGIYIVNPMSTRSEMCADNPYIVKIQPSLESQVASMLDNMKFERPDGHLYIIHGGSDEKPILNELKRQLSERGDIKYTLFNWSQSNKLTSTLKSTPNCNVLSIYEQKGDPMRVYVSNLLNRLAAIKSDSPTLYAFSDWSRDYADIDFSQLQLLNFHTFSSNWDLSNSVHVDFLTNFHDRFGTEPTSTLAATGYDLTLYILSGLSLRNTEFWSEPGMSLPNLIHPIKLKRRQAGLENNQTQLYRMESLRFVPATTK